MRDGATQVEFATEHGITLRGWLWRPEGPGPHPIVVMAHGFGALQDWTLPVIAREFARAGLAALTFDYRNFGDSDGMPREEVDHPGQIEDWRNAVTFASALDGIDADRIGIWGTSLGGRNVLIAAAFDRRVKAVFSQVPAIDWGDIVLRHQNNAIERQALLAAFDEDRAVRAAGGEPRYLARVQVPGNETSDYYTRLSDEERKNWKARVTLRSYEPTVASSALPFMSLIAPTPLLMLVLDSDVIAPTPSQLAAFEQALEPKKLVILPGRHFDVYFEPLRDEATSVATNFFAEHLL